MSHGEETGLGPIRKSTKYTGQCTRSNKINGNFGQNCQERKYV